MHLQQGTLLKNGDYRIEKVLGQGGFGITYLAEQVMLGRKVCVKEFFMKDLCERDESTSHVTVATGGLRDTVNRFREKFLKEARNIARMKHPNIVSIIDVFEENDTAYYVMEYAECGSLSAKVKSMGYMPEPMAVRYILQVASALEYVHRQKMNHLDVKPANIMLNEEDNAVLIDFGLSKQYDASSGGQTSSTPVGISHGYAPLEQYKEGGVSTFSPETDIYALGATFYCLLTGQAPPNATDVNEDGVPVDNLKSKGISQHIIDLISASMEPRKKVRMNSAKEFIKRLQEANGDSRNEDTEETEVTIKADEEKKVTVKTDEKPEVAVKVENVETELPEASGASDSKKGYIKWGIAALVVVLFGVIGFVLNGSINATGTPANKGDSVADAKNTITVNGVSFDMISVEGGTFTMGAHENQEADAFDWEKPNHQVTLDSYCIGETEVTQALWKAVMNNNPSEFKGDNLPVESVSWDDCQEFIKKLNTLTSKTFRLPTEAEWEFAARGGNKSKDYIYSGSNNLDDVAWYWKNSGDEYLNGSDDDWDFDKIKNNNCKTHPVKTKQPNELGLYDMSGNVWEWCQDWYGDYSSSSQTNPTGPNSGSRRVGRGGCWDGGAWRCRSSYRCGSRPDSRDNGLGLRLVLSE